MERKEKLYVIQNKSTGKKVLAPESYAKKLDKSGKTYKIISDSPSKHE